ncbi:Bug family tripartite tricarboxylate transporter substrate binding protein [Pseudaquabacterium pictum]|uniref:MFS transporter n=1 Tax=Pseudaquabacterium pictum TaxID=2315236 RepID=A0A480ANG3_9BURK|nr:tripartite tricarboxylate transporter substrate binding protein [Rubrivivax pictus]GCL63114.1 MFS transporter [Rubrivivax pictus]
MPRLNRRHLLQAALAGTAPAALTAAAPAALAQAGFPSKPIKFVVAFPPGGATDLVGRLIASKLQESWGQNVVVENKAGASGMIGSEQVMRAPPDGYTALVTITTHIQNSAIFAKVPYDPLKDFEPVSQICLSYLVLVVKPDFPANNLKEFIAHVKANPGKVSFGSFGTGSSSHIVGETFARKAGLDLAHVPYKGSALMLTDLLGGQIPCAWADVSTATQHIAAGKLKPLAVTGERRAPLLAQVPTLLELGFPGFEPLGWVGILLPAGTPKPIVDKYSNEIVRIVKLPEVRARLYEQTLMPVGDNAASFARTLKRDKQLWQNIVTAAGIKPQ